MILAQLCPHRAAAASTPSRAAGPGDKVARGNYAALGTIMKLALLIGGILILLLGLHWISEGTGILAYPHSPMMYLQPMWTYIGLATAIAGAALIWMSRR